MLTAAPFFYDLDRVGSEGDFAVRPDVSRPLRFVIHPTVPGDRVSIVERAVLSWNDAIHDVAGTRPIRVHRGADPSLLPGEPGVFVVMWQKTHGPANHNGVAQHVFDPRSGELYAGGVLLPDANLRGSDSREPLMEILERHRPPPRPARSLSRAERLERRAAFVVAHEVGHLLGLRHNFAGSSDLARVAPGEFTTTVMDYLPDSYSPVAPQAGDRYALAHLLGRPPKPAFAGPYRLGDDGSEMTDPDATQFDWGEPVEHAIAQFAELRAARATDAELAKNPEIYRGHLVSQLEPVAKALLRPADPRHLKALEFCERTLADRGTAVDRGGVAGQETEKVVQPPQAVMWLVHGSERLAVCQLIAGLPERGPVPATIEKRLCAALVRTVVARDHGDALYVRQMALAYLKALGSDGARIAMRDASKSLRASAGKKRGVSAAQDETLADMIDLYLEDQAGEPAK